MSPKINVIDMFGYRYHHRMKIHAIYDDTYAACYAYNLRNIQIG